jgi:hypothetical protein
MKKLLIFSILPLFLNSCGGGNTPSIEDASLISSTSTTGILNASEEEATSC